MPEPLIVTANVVGKPGSGPCIERAAHECIKASRQEPGCILYTCNKDLHRADHYVFVECWVNQKALDAHASSTHFKAFAAALTPMLAAPLGISIMHNIDGAK